MRERFQQQQGNEQDNELLVIHNKERIARTKG
jgi:hypothetical protein